MKFTKRLLEKANAGWTDYRYYEKDEDGTWKEYKNSMRAYEATNGVEVNEEEVYNNIYWGCIAEQDCGLVINGKKTAIQIPKKKYIVTFQKHEYKENINAYGYKEAISTQTYTSLEITAVTKEQAKKEALFVYNGSGKLWNCKEVKK